MSEKSTPEEIKRVRNEYYRKWRKNNPEKVKAAQLRYWQKKLEEERRNKTPTLPDDVEYR